ncbi:MAG: MBL fold metallo-hydrolase [Chlorobi bacterium]|nr:MBL fold metallo-hydrolase [Chlorobiota bacterium]
MEVLFLGTGASLGVPVLGCTCDVCRSEAAEDQRLRTSVLVRSAGEHILIDAGPDFRAQCLTHGITRIDSFLFTHPHFDHIGGLDETRAVYYAMDRRPLHFYAEEFTFEGIRKHFDYLFPASGKPQYHGAPEYRFITLEAGKPFDTKANRVTPLRAWHGDMPVTGYRIGKLVYLTDVKKVPEPARAAIDKDTVLVVSALHRKPHPLHFNLDEALEFIDQTRPARAYLTHISHWMGKWAEVKEEIRRRRLPVPVMPAYDGLRIHI